MLETGVWKGCILLLESGVWKGRVLLLETGHVDGGHGGLGGELVPGVLRTGGRGREGMVSQLQVLPGQGLVVQLEEAGDEVRPAWSGLGMVHPATLDDLPQFPGTVTRSAHPVALLDQL